MEHLYFVAYDIRCDKRWRKVYRTLKGYGVWLQYSVFQCRLDKARKLMLADQLSLLIDRTEDHVVIIDIGPADAVKPKVISIGKPFEAIEKKPVIV